MIHMNAILTSVTFYKKVCSPDRKTLRSRWQAYFSPDGSRLIYQSNRNGYACDKIWIMNIDGSDKHMVSPDHGAHTCSFFFPDGKRIIFSSTSHLLGACPQ